MPITINLKGRIGNQLFEYAVLRNLSINKGYDVLLNTNCPWHGQEGLLKYFNICNYQSPINSRFFHHYNQPNDAKFYDSNINNILDNTILNGHFVNEKYFKENENIIKDELTINDININAWSNNYIKELTNDNSKVVGIHFRRGDVVSQINDVKKFNEDCITFANNSIKKILEIEQNIVILIFTGGYRAAASNNHWNNNTQHDDLTWLNNFKINNLNYKIIISPGSIENNELKDYDLLSKCDYNVLPWPSTFSWMACYVNKKNHKKVYYNTEINADILAADKFLT